MTNPSRVLSKAREAVSGASLYFVESAPAQAQGWAHGWAQGWGCGEGWGVG